MSREHLDRIGSEPDNHTSSNTRANIQTAVINRALKKTRKHPRRRERLTLAHEILGKLEPPDQHALKNFWKWKFRDAPTDNLPFEPTPLSIHDLARAVNLREDRLIRHVQTLEEHDCVECDSGMYSITPRGQKVLAKLNELLSHRLIRPLVEDLERTTPDTHAKANTKNTA